MKEHSNNIDWINKVVEDSTSSCLQTTEKVDKLIFEMKTFISEIQTATANNATQVNDIIFNLNASIRKERESLEKLQADISANNSEF